MGSCCGGSRANVDYEVTLPDGTVEIVGSLPEVRILRAANQVPGGKALTYKAVPRKK